MLIRAFPLPFSPSLLAQLRSPAPGPPPPLGPVPSAWIFRGSDSAGVRREPRGQGFTPALYKKGAWVAFASPNVHLLPERGTRRFATNYFYFLFFTAVEIAFLSLLSTFSPRGKIRARVSARDFCPGADKICGHGRHTQAAPSKATDRWCLDFIVSLRAEMKTACPHRSALSGELHLRANPRGRRGAGQQGRGRRRWVWFCFDPVGLAFFFFFSQSEGLWWGEAAGGDEPPLPKPSGSLPHPTVPRSRSDPNSPFWQNWFFSSFLGAPSRREMGRGWGGVGEGLPAASSWGERGWEIHRAPPLPPAPSSPSVDYRRSPVT